MGIEGIQPKVIISEFKDEISSCKSDKQYAKVLDASEQLADSFKKTDSEGNSVKSPLGTLISVAGVAISTFMMGKKLGSLGTKLASKLPQGVKGTIVNTAKNAVEFVNKKIGSIKNAKIADKLTNVFSSVVEYVAKNPKKAISNAAGAVAVATVGKEIINADGNGDGIADIAQKNVNAYSSALKNADLLADIANAVM